MPIRLDYEKSRELFEKAFDLASSDADLPKAWVNRARKVGQSPSKTFIPMLGTALLARATNPKIDPFSLKTRSFPTAYSARSLCKDVLVPCAVEAGVHLGTTGREPLNNQPFFRHERVGPDMKVRPSTRPHLDYLCQALEAVKKLRGDRALEALAAFIRVRLEDGPSQPRPLRAERSLGVPDLAAQALAFITDDPETGKRGQALVAASLDLVFEDVRTTRVFDPSRHWPGDVVVFDEEVMTLSVEVKQRKATFSEILQFAGRCAAMGVHRALAALLAPDQELLEVDELRAEAWQRHGVHLSVLEGADGLLLTALTWTLRELPDALKTFPQHMAARLAELEVSKEGQRQWEALFKEGS
jgi:hypothetical protein